MYLAIWPLLEEYNADDAIDDIRAKITCISWMTCFSLYFDDPWMDVSRFCSLTSFMNDDIPHLAHSSILLTALNLSIYNNKRPMLIFPMCWHVVIHFWSSTGCTNTTFILYSCTYWWRWTFLYYYYYYSYVSISKCNLAYNDRAILANVFNANTRQPDELWDDNI